MSLGRNHYKSRSELQLYSKELALTLYVRSGGHDKHDGLSLERSVQTLGRAISLCPEKSDRAIIIDVGPGEWEEDITIPPVRFFGSKKFSRSLCSRVGIEGHKTEQLGLIIRGSPGPVQSSFFQYEVGKSFNPTPILSEDRIDGNIYNYFYPSSKILGTVYTQPATTLELATLEIGAVDKPYGVCSFGSIITAKGISFIRSQVGISAESFSDIRLSGCLFGNKVVHMKGRSSSIISVDNTHFSALKRFFEAQDRSFISISNSSLGGVGLTVGLDYSDIVIQSLSNTTIVGDSGSIFKLTQVASQGS